jgi:hypothetical protein
LERDSQTLFPEIGFICSVTLLEDEVTAGGNLSAAIWRDNIKTDLKAKHCGDLDWIELAQDSVQ